jgi:O-Antigen ligase/Tetratricopeptide repeat
MKMVRGRLQLAVLALLLAVAPWFRGGRDASGLLIQALFLCLGLVCVRGVAGGHIRVSRLGWWFVGLGLWGGLSWLWSSNRFLTTSWVVVWALSGVAAMLAHRVATTTEGRARLVRAYLELCLVFSAYGLWLFVTGDYNRLTSTFYWANPWATFLLPAVLISWWRYLRQGGGLYLAISTMLLCSFVLSYSRAAFVVMALSSLLLLMEERVKLPWIRIVFSLVLVISGVLVASTLRTRVYHQNSLGVSQRFAEALKGESTSGLDRVYYLRSALGMWLDHPWVGSGAGSYETLHPQYQLRVISAGSSAHNAYLQLVAETGLVGLVLVVGLVLELVLGLWRRARKGENETVLVIGVLAMLVHMGLDIGSSFPSVMLLSAVLVGALYKPGHQREAALVEGTEPNPSPLSWMRTTANHLPFGWLAWPVMALLAQPLWATYQSSLWTAAAHDQEDQGHYLEAASDYQEAHLQLTYNPDTFTREGIMYFTMASGGQDASWNTTQAQRKAEAGIQQDPHNAANYLLLGRTRWLAGDKRQAESAYTKALLLDPYNVPQTYTDLANLYLTEQRYTEALELAGSGLSKYTPEVISNRNSLAELPGQIAELYVARGHAWEGLGDSAQALEAARQAVRTDPSSVLAGNMYKRLSGTSTIPR